VPSFRILVELLLSQRGPARHDAGRRRRRCGVAPLLLAPRPCARKRGWIAALVVVEPHLETRPRHPISFRASAAGCRAHAFLIPLLPFPRLRARSGAAAPTGDHRCARAHLPPARWFVATSAEPLLMNDDTRHWLSRIGHGQLHRDRRQPRRRSGTAGSRSSRSTRSCSSEPQRHSSRRQLPVFAARTWPCPEQRCWAWVLVEHGAPGSSSRVDRLVHQSWGLLAAIGLPRGRARVGRAEAASGRALAAAVRDPSASTTTRKWALPAGPASRARDAGHTIAPWPRSTRKYRPQTFDDVVGAGGGRSHAEERDHVGAGAPGVSLRRAPRGTGKTSMARILAKSLNCVLGPTAEPDGTCSVLPSASPPARHST